MEIKIERAKTLKPKPAANTELGFGRYYTDHMFVLDWPASFHSHRSRSILPPWFCTMRRKHLKA